MSTGYIPQDILDEIVAKSDIVSVVSEYVPLKRKGSNYQGLCPFHGEKTPSFSVSPNKQIFHCFGCGKGGNVFKFLMEIEGIPFLEAVEKLAKKANIKLPEKELSQAEKERLKQRSRYLQINEATAKYYHKVLLETTAGVVFKQYLEQRGISAEIIKKFQLGAAPAGWDHLYRFLLSHRVTPQEMMALGLISQGKKKDQYFDRFRQRIIFPICDERGNVIAFGGRIIDKEASPQKYLNSPDTPLFHKSRNLYALNLAKSAIRSQDMVVIVEGYMDVISCHQHGIINAVAPLGTAFTVEQAKMLMRSTYQFSIAFDGDKAGQNAALRSLDILSDLGCSGRVIQFPDGTDPDEFLKKYGKEAFEQLILKSQDPIVYKIGRLMENTNIDSVTGKTSVIERLLPDLLKMHSAVALESAMKEVSVRLGVTEKALWDEMKRYKQKKPIRNIEGQAAVDSKELPASSISISRTEAAVLRILFTNPASIVQVEALGGARLFSSEVAALYQEFKHSYDRHGKIESADIGEEKGQLLANILIEDEMIVDGDKLLHNYLLQLKQEQLDHRYQLLVNRLAEAEKMGATEEMLQALHELEIIRKEKKDCETFRKGE